MPPTAPPPPPLPPHHVPPAVSVIKHLLPVTVFAAFSYGMRMDYNYMLKKNK